jgi:hypothetical protein
MAQERFGFKKRTLDVRLTPESGRNWQWLRMSASDPKATLSIGEATTPFGMKAAPTLAATREKRY